MTPAVPRAFSAVPEDTDIETTKLGMKMLGFEADHVDGLFPQSRKVGQLMEARDEEGGALYKTCVIEIGRRATKSTSVWATIIGRAMTRPGYKCVTTAQSGTIASAILLEHGSLLEANGYSGFKRSAFATEDEPDGDGTMRLLRNGGRERIEFRNGSVIWCVPPNVAAVRSRASDDILVDESGEFEGDKGTDFISGTLPLMDTRGELAQLIIAGTPGKVRAGMFWDNLEDGRNGTDEDMGILDYSLTDVEVGELVAKPWAELTEEEKATEREVWKRVHPGPSSVKPDGSTLTSIRTLERRRKKMPVAQFWREYLCIWPADGASSAIDMEKWALSETEAQPLPARYAWAYDVAPDGSSACVVAAWRDAEGLAWVEVMEYMYGTEGLGRYVQKVARSGQRQPIAYDKIGANLETAARLDMMKPRVRSHGMHYTKGAVPAEQSFVRELDAGRIRHTGQEILTDALDGAAWRQGEGFRLWGRKSSANDITPAVAAAMALWEYDTVVARKSDLGVIAPM